jgi:predicted GNAT superfamily acetyltransferase
MIHVRPLVKLAEMRPVVELQRTYWGTDLESVVPGHMLYSIVNAGGHVLGAYDGTRLIGALIGQVALNSDLNRSLSERLHIASKRMVVLPEYRSQGVGSKLKLAQRQIAIQQGINMVTWTFDPLLSTNAHLNIRKLRGMCRLFLPNYYGTDDAGGLARFGSSDRLLIEWHVNAPVVVKVLDSGYPLRSWEDYVRAEVPIANPATRNECDVLTPSAEWSLRADDDSLLVEIPSRYEDLVITEPNTAQVWQTHIRGGFTRLFAAGYVVTDFIHTGETGIERSFYVLNLNFSSP